MCTLMSRLGVMQPSVTIDRISHGGFLATHNKSIDSLTVWNCFGHNTFLLVVMCQVVMGLMRLISISVDIFQLILRTN